MGRKHRGGRRVGRKAETQAAVVGSLPPPLQAHAAAPSRWRDPALIVAMAGIVIAILSALYAREQAKVSDAQLERETLIAKNRALGVAVRATIKLDKALDGCLKNSLPMDACVDVLAIADDVQLAAQDPELATYYPLLHVDLGALYTEMLLENVADAIHILQNVQRHVDTEVRALNQFDLGLDWGLTFKADDMEAHEALRKKFARPVGGSGSSDAVVR